MNIVMKRRSTGKSVYYSYCMWYMKYLPTFITCLPLFVVAAFNNGIEVAKDVKRKGLKVVEFSFHLQYIPLPTFNGGSHICIPSDICYMLCV